MVPACWSPIHICCCGTLQNALHQVFAKCKRREPFTQTVTGHATQIDPRDFEAPDLPNQSCVALSSLSLSRPSSPSHSVTNHPTTPTSHVKNKLHRSHPHPAHLRIVDPTTRVGAHTPTVRIALPSLLARLLLVQLTIIHSHQSLHLRNSSPRHLHRDEFELTSSLFGRRRSRRTGVLPAEEVFRFGVNVGGRAAESEWGSVEKSSWRLGDAKRWGD